MDLQTLQNVFKTHKESLLYGRYISVEHLVPLFEKHQNHFDIETIGTSVLEQSIKVIKIGKGKTKILMWSQMHGNESTTTKAVFDLCNMFANPQETAIKKIVETCTIAIIPMLNPDGAKVYTRLNANGIDLNRDAQDLSQPESRALRSFFEKFQPDFGFNLHGQRTIFSAGNFNKSATVSFLAPAQDKMCSLTQTRKKAMEIIVKMNENLQSQIPGQVGIYDDAFNINCVGDTFQSLEVPTILFEAGHFADDYDREVVRGFVFQSLLVAISEIANPSNKGSNYTSYFDIPKNEKLYYDIIIRNVKRSGQILDISIQFEEQLVGQKIDFCPKVEKIASLNEFYAHKDINANSLEVLDAHGQELREGYAIDFVVIDNEKFALKTKNI